MIAKLLENPISIPILKLLSKKQLSIPQITNSLQDIDTDMKTVTAILTELYHFGLVERVETTAFDTSTQNGIQLEKDVKLLEKTKSKFYTTPLGIPLHNFVSLWEGVTQHPDQLDSSEEWIFSEIFSVPTHLQKEFEDLTLEEIRCKILNKSY
ncbi:MAG: hypothetical protein ACXADY_00715 [Candidatus Hodarchaeales archaeon]